MRKNGSAALLDSRTLKSKALTLLLAVMTALGLTAGSIVVTDIAGLGTTVTAYADEASDALAISEGTTVLAFTSDTHNKEGNIAANRLGIWIDNMRSLYGEIEVMAFGGDMGDYNVSSSTYWTLTQADMDVLTSKGLEAIYTTGNHEYSPGNYSSSSTSATQRAFKIDAEGKEGSNYRIYCLGSQSSTSSYANQVSSLESYLNSVGNDKPIFIITHYPLHYYSSSRKTTSATDIIGVLNAAVANNGQKIVFLWGHNHTMSDSYYDQVYVPGDSILTSKTGTTKIQFYYAAAGCMSDSEYLTGSAYVKGKGLIVTINSKNRLSFAYYDANGTNVTEGGTYSEPTEFTVTFQDDDGTELSSAEYVEGTAGTGIAVPEDPAKEATAEFSYAFAGWSDGTSTYGSDALPAVTADVIYTATYTATKRSYEITWIDGDSNELRVDQVEYGTRPTYQGDDPAKAATDQYSYVFSGWTDGTGTYGKADELPEVAGDVTYTATFDEAVRSYAVTFVDEDGETVLLEAVEYPYGTAAADVARPEDPSKEATAEYTYAFAGWDPEVAIVTGTATYTATYMTTRRSYAVAFVDWDGTMISSGTYEYGTPAASITPADPNRAADGQYTYEFAGWDADVVDVVGEATYNATYTATEVVRNEIVAHPSDVAVAEGQPFALSVGATGDVPSYRWEHSDDGGASWRAVRWAGHDTDTIGHAMVAALDGRMFRCVVAFADGTSETSGAATVTLAT